MLVPSLDLARGRSQGLDNCLSELKKGGGGGGGLSLLFKEYISYHSHTHTHTESDVRRADLCRGCTATGGGGGGGGATAAAEETRAVFQESPRCAAELSCLSRH